jgi:hypothetical protein
MAGLEAPPKSTTQQLIERPQEVAHRALGGSRESTL